MSQRLVEVEAPSRVHFGMLSFGRQGARQFGGAGMMIARPGLKLSILPAARFDVAGPLADRATAFARRIAGRLCGVEEPPCRIRIHRAPPQHVGLGTGTQLGMALAAGLHQFLCSEPLPTPTQLAELAGRGLRSAVGLYGFAKGGLIVEAGKSADDRAAPLVARLPMPAAWRVVLIRPDGEKGLSGEAEKRAFGRLAPVPEEITNRLCEELLLHLLPAVRQRRLDEFGESLYRFGYLAGTCFATQQGSAFATPCLAELVERIRALGVRGVGQSSWGPTLFAVVGSADAARRLVDKLRHSEGTPLDCTITRMANQGASVRVVGPSLQAAIAMQ